MDAVRNLVDLEESRNNKDDDGEDGGEGKIIGFNPEIYVGEEQHKGGLRVKRFSDGKVCGDTFEVNLAPQAPT